MEHLDLKAMEKKMIMTYHQDGLLDLVVGLMCFCYGLVIISGIMGLLGLTVLPVVLYVPLKKKITVPRIGFVEFAVKHQHRALRAGITLMLLGFFMGLAFPYRSNHPILQFVLDDHFLGFFGFIVGSIVLIAASALGVRRYFAYGALVIAGFALADILRGGLVWVFFGLGAICILWGLIILTGFIRKYPPNEAES